MLKVSTNQLTIKYAKISFILDKSKFRRAFWAFGKKYVILPTIQKQKK